MRAGILLAVALVTSLVGCKREPTFEERYDTANKSIVDRAKRIDAQIAGTAAPADEGAAEAAK